MREILEIYHEKTPIKVRVTLTPGKSTPELRRFGRTHISSRGTFIPYWFEGFDGKDFERGGWWDENLGLINLTLNGPNVQGVMYGSKLYYLTKIEKL